jgi:DNA-directed RNA polymerase I subunit RPA49
MTTENETSLLTHLFSLCLKVDDYATDTALIAADLKMSSARYPLQMMHVVID